MPPDQTGKLPLKLSTRGHPGLTNRVVQIWTNIPEPNNLLTVTIKGDVWEPIACEPRMASFGRLTKEEAADTSRSVKVTVTNNLDTPAKLTELRCNSPLFRAEVKELEEGKKFELTVTLADKLPTGNTNAAIEFATGVDDPPTATLPVNVFVAPDVEVMPPSIMVPPQRPQDHRQDITVRNNTKTHIKVTDLNVTNPDIRFQLTEVQPGVEFRITLTIPTTAKLTETGDKLTFRTDCPGFEAITVSIQAFPVPTQPAKPMTQPARPATQPARPTTQFVGPPAP